MYKDNIASEKEQKKKLQEQRALASHREAIRRETKQKEQQSKAEQKKKESQEKHNQVQFLRQQTMPGGGMMQQTMQQPTYGNMFNAGHVVNPQNYMQQQFQQQQQQQQNSMDAMVPMMAQMIQQALATAGVVTNPTIGNQSTMAGPNGTVVQAPTAQAPGQQQQRDTSNYLTNLHGQTQQSEVPTLLFSDIHGEEEEAGNTGNNDSNSPVFTPPHSHRGQLCVDTQAGTPESYSPPKGMDLSQQSNPVSDGEEGS